MSQTSAIPFKGGHMHRRNPCSICGRGTRRTVLVDGVRVVQCGGCSTVGKVTVIEFDGPPFFGGAGDDFPAASLDYAIKEGIL